MKKDEAKQQIAEGLEKLSEAIQNGKSEEFERYLSVMSRFRNYSWGNTLLILCQRPESTRVAGYTKWRELGRQVKKGETGIGIIAPLRYKVEDEHGEEGVAVKGFKVVHVFDVSQTQGEELPEFAVATGEPGQNLARIEAAITSKGIELVEADHLGGANGSSTGGVIEILSSLPPAERFRVLCHELAHSLLHFGERRHETTRTVRETEAEAVAFVVSTALGIDALKRSSDYIQLYRGNTDTLAESLEYIQKTAVEVLELIETVELPKAGKDTAEPVEASEEQFEDEPPQELRIGRADYEERREARLERLQGSAESARASASATYEQAHSMASAIPFGQPILVGHHSERRDRNYRARIERTYQRSFELSDKAKDCESRAAAAEGNDAISSDDPEALVKLREKLAELEAQQAYMKRLNVAWRNAGRPKSANTAGWAKVAANLGVEPEKVERMRKAMAGVEHFSGADAAPCPPYQLQNNNANIRRVKQRISELEREGTLTESTEVDHGMCRVVQNVDANRIQLVFPGKPEDAVRTLLKQSGFRWSRREGAWQRHLNDAGRYAAKRVVEQLTKKGGDTGHEETQELGAE